MNIVLVRHGEPAVDENLAPREWPLSERGRIACRALAGVVAAYAPERVVSSVERKAIETAAILASGLGLHSAVVDGLHEHERTGFLERDAFEAGVRALFDRPDELVFGTETAAAARARFAAAIEGLGASTAVVAHGTVIALYAGGYDLWRRLTLPSVVVVRDGRVQAVHTF